MGGTPATTMPFCTQVIPRNLPKEEIKALPGGNRQDLAVQRSYIWPNGSELRVKFLGGSPTVQTKVKKYAVEWMQYANIKFLFVNEGHTDIRVSFKQDNTYWSYIGTYNKQEPQDKPTLNLSLDDSTPDSEISRTTIHEFGHAIGCIHEHQSPAVTIPWDKPKVYHYYLENYSWDKDMVDNNIFNHHGAEATDFSKFDSKSIMLYAIPDYLTIGGFSTNWNTVLSETDKSFIARIYPKDNKKTSLVNDAKGILEVGSYLTGSDWQKVVRGEKRSKKFQISIPQLKPPHVVLGLSALDMNAVTIRANAYVDEISSTEFNVHVDSWEDTLLYNATASWMLVAADDPDFQCGVFDVGSIRSWENPGVVVRRVNFPKAYTTQPKVFVGISGIDVTKQWRLNVYATDIDRRGFTLHFFTSGSAQLRSARADWIAFPADKAGVTIGSFGGEDRFDGYVSFGSEFSRPPRVFSALGQFDINNSKNLRLTMRTNNITASGMDWKFETWSDSELYSVTGVYLAIDM